MTGKKNMQRVIGSPGHVVGGQPLYWWKRCAMEPGGLSLWQLFLDSDHAVFCSFCGARIVILDKFEVPDYIQLCSNEGTLRMKGPEAEYQRLL